MPINPTTAHATGDKTGIATALADIKRRLAAVEAGGGGTSLPPGSVDGSQVAVGSITTAHITAGGINASTITAHTITALQIAAGTLTATEIAAGTITAGNIAAGTITATQIAANTITANQIAANTITAGQISATTLQTLWTSAGTINGGTIIGGVFKTATSGARVEITSSAMTAYALNGTTKTLEANFGTGVLTVTGIVLADPSSTIPATSLTGFVGGGNLWTNSSLESTDAAQTVASQWTTLASTISQSATQAFHGSYSLKILNNTTSSTAYAFASLEAPPTLVVRGKPLVVSVWVYIAGSDNSTPADNRIFTPWDGTTQASPLASSITKNSWQRVVIKWTPSASAPYIQLFAFNPWISGTNTVYFDAFQVELGDAATGYAPKGDEILYSSIRSLFIGAGEIKANNIAAGAITATSLSVTMPGQVVSLVNGNFAYDAAVGGTPTGWSAMAGSWLVASDSVFTRCVSVTTPASNGNYYMQQSITLPKGRHIFSGWCKTSSITGTSGGAYIGGGFNSGTGSVTISAALFGTVADWTPLSAIINVTSSTADLIVYTVVGFAVQGTASFANLQIQSSVGSTLITPNSITSGQIMADTITAAEIASNAITVNELAAGSVSVAKLAFTMAGANKLRNSNYFQWASGGSPDLWQPYDNGGTAGTVTWSKVAAGGPNGENAWRLTTTAAATAARGFMNQEQNRIRPNTTYVFSWYWKGAQAPDIASNTTWDVQNTWVDNPAPSTTVWQRYSKRMQSSIGGGISGADYFYVFSPAIYTGATDNQICLCQMEEGDVASGWKQFIDPTVVDGGSITSAVIKTNTSSTRLQMDDSGGFQVYNSGVLTAQMKAGLGGLDILAATSMTPPIYQRVRFLASGTEAAALWGFTSSGSNGVVVSATAPAAGSSEAHLHVYDSAGTTKTAIDLSYLSGYSSIIVKAGASANNRFLIDDTGASMYMQSFGNAVSTGSANKTIWRGPYYHQYAGLTGGNAGSYAWTHSLGLANYIVVGAVHNFNNPSGTIVSWDYQVNSTNQVTLRWHNEGAATATFDFHFWLVETPASVSV